MKPTASISRGFTLIEMMVAVSLLVIVILAVGKIFQDASKAIGMSQASAEAFSNVRAFAEQLELDIHSMDRSGFLVIRCSTFTQPNGTVLQQDQISFLAHGQFPHRTGISTPNPFADPVVGNAAFIHIGHGVAEDAGAAAAAGGGQAGLVGVNQLPTGTNDNQFVILRNAMLLMQGPPAGGNLIAVSTVPPINVAAFSTLALLNPVPTGVAVGAGGELPIPAASLTSSRVDVVNMTPEAIMQSITNIVTTATRAAEPRFEANNYCYRYKTLTNPYATEVQVNSTPSLINGYYRMHPILLQGCANFSIEWSDGVTTRGQVLVSDPQYILNDTSLAWFGPNNTAGGIAPSFRYTAGTHTAEPAPVLPENYVAIFSFDNRTEWPKALKFTYRVTDPNDRLNGGRDFTQVIRLPE